MDQKSVRVSLGMALKTVASPYRRGMGRNIEM